jgi:hypothetical protein
MYKIIIKGEAKTDYENLKRLNGVSAHEEFSDYFGEDEQSLIDKDVCNGYMHFEFKDNKLWTVTTYESDVELTQKEIDVLADYTQGQWSDGIGEGFEQYPCMFTEDNEEIYISAWHDKQVLIT